MQLRREYIPRLVKLVIVEQKLRKKSGSGHTMPLLFQMLFFYNEITREYGNRDPDDPKLIDMLPVLVNISESLLKEGSIKDLEASGEYEE